MSSEQERKIVVRKEGPRSLLGTLAERIPFTSAYSERLRRLMYEDLERCLKEEVIPDLKEKGLLGKHSLIRWSPQRGVWGSLEGGLEGGMFFFVGSVRGQIEGELRSVSSLQFAWQPNDQMGVIISEIPVDEFVFKVEEGVEVPSVEFHY